MSTESIDEDSVDTEALQAQIDMSMSFAQGLISSWMEPHKFPKSSRRRNLEEELTNYMKRPPRLGVGAAVPEGMQSQTQETARLKGKLNTKRSREEVEVDCSNAAPADEGESRAVAIKKKARFDPFDVVHGKKKKQRTTGPATVKVNLEASSSKDPSLESSQEMEFLPPEIIDERTGTEIKTGLVDTATQSIPPSKLSGPQSTSPQSHKTNKGSEVTTDVSTKSSLRTTLSSDPLKVPVPLLNLSGPPSDPESDCEPTTPSTTPKKKRRRRKKKKSHPTTVGSEDAATK